jgi:hypothetical protein
MGISSVNKILNNFRTIQAITANVNLFDKAWRKEFYSYAKDTKIDYRAHFYPKTASIGYFQPK